MSEDLINWIDSLDKRFKTLLHKQNHQEEDLRRQQQRQAAEERERWESRDSASMYEIDHQQFERLGQTLEKYITMPHAQAAATSSVDQQQKVRPENDEEEGEEEEGEEEELFLLLLLSPEETTSITCLCLDRIDDNSIKLVGMLS